MSNFSKNQERLVVNHQIRAFKVLCIDHNNVNLGILPLSQALSLASSNGLDLVQMSPPDRDQPPTCKILDSGKYKFELSIKQKEANKKQRESAIKTKIIKMRPSTDLNDLKVKAKKVEEFIDEGCRVQILINFKGREVTHQNVGLDTLTTFMTFLPKLQMIGRPSLDRKDLSVFLTKRTEM